MQDQAAHRPPRLLDQVRAVCRRAGYSLRTEKACWRWIKRYVTFHQLRHPRELGAHHVRAFLSHLAMERQVAASTQNQALNALVFLYRDVLAKQLASCATTLRPFRSKQSRVISSAQVGWYVGDLSARYALSR